MYCIHNACVSTWFVSTICTRWMTILLNSKNHRYSPTYLRPDVPLFKNSHIMYFIIVQVLSRALMGCTIPCFWSQSIHIVDPTIIYSFFSSETIDAYLSVTRIYMLFYVLQPTVSLIYIFLYLKDSGPTPTKNFCVKLILTKRHLSTFYLAIMGDNKGWGVPPPLSSRPCCVEPPTAGSFSAETFVHSSLYDSVIYIL